MESFSIDNATMDDVAVVSVTGDVDMSQAVALRDALADCSGPVVVDLHGCRYMGSDGVRALLEGRRLATEREERFVVCVPESGIVARLLEIVGGATLFNLEADRDAAVSLAATQDRRFGDRRRLAA